MPPFKGTGAQAGRDARRAAGALIEGRQGMVKRGTQRPVALGIGPGALPLVRANPAAVYYPRPRGSGIAAMMRGAFSGILRSFIKAEPSQAAGEAAIEAAINEAMRVGEPLPAIPIPDRLRTSANAAVAAAGAGAGAAAGAAAGAGAGAGAAAGAGAGAADEPVHMNYNQIEDALYGVIDVNNPIRRYVMNDEESNENMNVVASAGAGAGAGAGARPIKSIYNMNFGPAGEYHWARLLNIGAGKPIIELNRVALLQALVNQTTGGPSTFGTRMYTPAGKKAFGFVGPESRRAIEGRVPASEQCKAVFEYTHKNPIRGIAPMYNSKGEIDATDNCYICGIQFAYYASITRFDNKPTSPYVISTKYCAPADCDHVLPLVQTIIFFGVFRGPRIGRSDKNHPEHRAFMHRLSTFGYRYACKHCNITKSNTSFLKWDAITGRYIADVAIIKSMLIDIYGTEYKSNEISSVSGFSAFTLQMHVKNNPKYSKDRNNWITERADSISLFVNAIGANIMGQSGDVGQILGNLQVTIAELHNPRNYTPTYRGYIKFFLKGGLMPEDHAVLRVLNNGLKINESKFVSLTRRPDNGKVTFARFKKRDGGGHIGGGTPSDNSLSSPVIIDKKELKELEEAYDALVDASKLTFTWDTLKPIFNGITSYVHLFFEKYPGGIGTDSLICVDEETGEEYIPVDMEVLERSRIGINVPPLPTRSNTTVNANLLKPLNLRSLRPSSKTRSNRSNLLKPLNLRSLRPPSNTRKQRVNNVRNRYSANQASYSANTYNAISNADLAAAGVTQAQVNAARASGAPGFRVGTPAIAATGPGYRYGRGGRRRTQRKGKYTPLRSKRRHTIRKRKHKRRAA
jgi:hypothetical protein